MLVAKGKTLVANATVLVAILSPRFAFGEAIFSGLTGVSLGLGFWVFMC